VTLKCLYFITIHLIIFPYFVQIVQKADSFLNSLQNIKTLETAQYSLNQFTPKVFTSVDYISVRNIKHIELILSEQLFFAEKAFFYIFFQGITLGQVLLLKGDITREKHSKIVQLHSSDYPVTNLNCFNDILYVTTVKDAQFYKLKEKSPGKIPLNAKGCAPNCAAISDHGELILGSVTNKT